MRKNRNILRSSIITTFISVFIVFYFSIIGIIYTIPNKYQGQNSWIMYVGFIIVIIGIFLFFFIKKPILEKNNLNVKFLSENFIKIILLVLMSISLYIKPITFSNTLIAWKEVNFLNILRAIIFIISLGFLPGASLFKLIFPQNTIHKRFKVEPFIIKIAFYPILSFIFLGTCVLIIENMGIINQELFMIFLYLIILILALLDFLIQLLRNKMKFKQNLFINKINSIKISSSTLIVLILSVGVIFISLGIHTTIQYLISGDSWTGIRPALYIGKVNFSPIDYAKQSRYPIFWGYISYGFSILSGIPLVNINALLAPYSYLHIIITYLFMKSILYKFKPKYIVFSTILVSIFSGFFFFSPYKGDQAIVSSMFLNIGALNYIGQLSFIYKSFSLYLVYFALAIFVIACESNRKNHEKSKSSLETYLLIIISALFLLISYMVYMLPLMIGLIFIFIYTLISNKKLQNLRFFYIFLIFLVFFFYLFDLMTKDLNNFLFSDKFSDFLIWLSLLRVENGGDKLIFDNLPYFFFFGVIFLFTIILSLEICLRKIRLGRYGFFKKNNQKLKSILRKKKQGIIVVKNYVLKLFFIFFLSLFTLSLFLQFFNLLFKQYVFRFIYVEQNYWFYFITIFFDETFLNFGGLGIIGIYLSYFSYKKNKKLFYILGTWLIINLIYSSLNFLNGFLLDKIILMPPQEIEYDQMKYMRVWYSRNWYFIVPVLCIFAAIGIIRLMKVFKDKVFKSRTHKNIKILLKSILISNIIIFGYTSFITSAIYWGRDEGSATLRDSQAQILGWISKNLPNRATVLTEKDFLIINGLEDLTYVQFYHTKEIIWANRNYSFNLEWIKRKNVTYAILYNGSHPAVHPTVSDFLDNFLTQVYLSEIIYKYEDLIIYTNSSLI